MPDARPLSVSCNDKAALQRRWPIGRCTTPSTKPRHWGNLRAATTMLQVKGYCGQVHAHMGQKGFWIGRRNVHSFIVNRFNEKKSFEELVLGCLTLHRANAGDVREKEHGSAEEELLNQTIIADLPISKKIEQVPGHCPHHSALCGDQ